MTRISDPLPPPGEGIATASAARWAVCALLCAAVGLGTAALIRATARSLRPPPAIARFTDKFVYWQAHADEFDVLIFGTSSVYRGIDPLVFDARTAQLGSPTRSFNASLPGLKFADQAYFLGQYLRASADSLRWVIVEPNLRAFLYYDNVDRERVTLVHDLSNTRDLVELVFHSPLDIDDKLEFATNHVLAASYRAAGAGEIARLIRPGKLPRSDPNLAASRGFETIEDAYPNERGIRAAAFSKLVAGLADGTIPNDFNEVETASLPAVAVRRFRAIAEAVPPRARLAWLVMPHFGKSIAGRFRNSHAAGEFGGVLLDLEDPVRSPGARNPRFFSDRTHLNSRGALHMSRRLAGIFARAAAEAP